MTEEGLSIPPKAKDDIFTPVIVVLIILAGGIVVYNAFQINSITGLTSGLSSYSGGSSALELSDVDFSSIKTTAGSIAAVFPINDFKTSNDAMAYMFPTGTPDYGSALGVSFDDPVGSLNVLSNMYNSLKAEVKQNNPDAWSRFMNLASKPVGISCEYCCGVGPIGIDGNGNSACGCQHNPALLSTALYLTAYTDYSDGEILREVIRWKTLFFPKNMIELGMSLAGGDTSALQELPGMVGGC